MSQTHVTLTLRARGTVEAKLRLLVHKALPHAPATFKWAPPQGVRTCCANHSLWSPVARVTTRAKGTRQLAKIAITTHHEISWQCSLHLPSQRQRWAHLRPPGLGQKFKRVGQAMPYMDVDRHQMAPEGPHSLCGLVARRKYTDSGQEHAIEQQPHGSPGDLVSPAATSEPCQVHMAG